MKIGSQKRQERNYGKRERVFISLVILIKYSYFYISDRGPKKWTKGPDVGSKSRSTCYRYKDLLKDQKTLEDLGWKKVAESNANSDCDDGEADSTGSGFGEDAFQVEVCQNRHSNLLSVSQLMRKDRQLKIQFQKFQFQRDCLR